MTQTTGDLLGVMHPSNRKFGLAVGGIVLVIGVVNLLRGGAGQILIVLGLALVFLGLIFPGYLEFPKRIWIGLGTVLSRITNPIVMALIYYGSVTPVGWLARLSGRLRSTAKANPSLPTYWTKTPEREYSLKFFRRQF